MLWEYPVQEIKTPILMIKSKYNYRKLTINHSIFAWSYIARIKLFVKHCLDQEKKNDFIFTHDYLMYKELNLLKNSYQYKNHLCRMRNSWPGYQTIWKFSNKFFHHKNKKVLIWCPYINEQECYLKEFTMLGEVKV